MGYKRIQNRKILTFSIIICFSSLLLTAPFWLLQSSGLTQKSTDGPWVTSKVGDEADTFFDDSYVHEIRLYFNDSNWYNTLYNAHNKDPTDPYFPARFVSHGITIDSVGVRFKGLSSFGGSNFPFGGNQGIKKPFRIDFNEYDEDNNNGDETTFFGLKKLNLNNDFADATMLREKLFMDFSSNYVKTPRSVYIRLYINDNYYGLYLAMEHIDNTFVESRFGNDENGNIFKVEHGGTLEYRGENWRAYNGSYELKNNEEANNWSDLIELTNILTNTSPSNLSMLLEPIFDVKSGIYSIGLLNLFSSLDSYIGNARNYYLYDRDDTGQFTFLLWDSNLAFGSFRMLLKLGENATTLDPFPSSIMRTMGAQQPAGSGGRNLTLIKNFLAVESYNRTYLRALAQMLREGFNSSSVNTRVQELANIIRASVYDDPNFLFAKTVFESELANIARFVQERSVYLDRRLNDFAEKTDLSFNELMTINQGFISDPAGDYDQWVEIYNSGPGLVSLEKIFLTDDPTNPGKWELPAQNLSDGGFLLLWLDDEPNEGANHCPIQLKLAGDELFLYTYNGSSYELIDSVTYPALNAGISYGRYPNGEGLWFELNKIVSPSQPNQLFVIPTCLFINEFMADNEAAVADPDGKYTDWIEIFNAGNESIDLSGMYLTDDLANPATWRFPSATLVQAEDYLVIWADKSSSQNGLHASFALSADGEKVGLFAVDGETVIDYIVYTEQFTDASYGRFKDGTSTWDFLSPTPKSANKLGTHSVSLNPTPSPSNPSPSISPTNSPTTPVETPTASVSNSPSTPAPSTFDTTSPSPTNQQTPTPTPTATSTTSLITSPTETQINPENPKNSTTIIAIATVGLIIGLSSIFAIVINLIKKR